MDKVKNIQGNCLEIMKAFHNLCVEEDIKYSLAYGTMLGAIRHQGFIPWDDDLDIVITRDEYEKFAKVAHKLPSNMFLQTKESDGEYFRVFPKIRINDSELKEENSEHLNIHHGVWIDLFVLDKTPEDFDKFQKQFEQGAAPAERIRKNIFMMPGARDKGLARLVKNGIKIRNRMFKSGNVKKSNVDYQLILDSNQQYNDLKDNYYLFDFVYLEHFDFVKNKRIEPEKMEHLELVKFEDMEAYVMRDYDEMLTRWYGDYMQLPPEEERIPLHS